MDDMQRFKETYITECYELLADMEEKLLNFDDGSPDIEELNAIFRCAHSIKGGSGAFGFDEIKNFTHILEELLDKMRDGEISPTREIIDVLLTAVDIVKVMVDAAHTGTQVEEGLGNDVIIQLKDVVNNTSNTPINTEPVSNDINCDEEDEISIFDINFTPDKNIFLSGNEPLLLIKELKTLGEVVITADVSDIPTLDNINPEACYISWNFTLETERKQADIQEVFEFVEDNCKLSIQKIAGFAKEPPKNNITAPPSPATDNTSQNDTAAPNVKAADKKPPPAVTSIRVDVEKLDRLVNMVGEIVITQAMIASDATELHIDEHSALINGLTMLSQHTLELQEAVMSVRMQPVKSVFSRMPRIVRDLSSQLQKDIRLETVGENTEIDKTVIEQLSDPLTHMIRNSVDHGIDGPDSREARGVPKQGRILLSAEHTGGKIVIKISDDGRGINRDVVLTKAIEKGLVSENEQLTDAQIDNLIFMPGFSTAEVVSDISGRGVGMDVVKRNIEGLGGSVRVESIPMQGTTFIVTLPLTLAILDGMIVRVGEEKYIIPIGNIIETIKPNDTDVKQIAGANDLMNARGEYIPLVYLHKTFNVKNAIKKVSQALVVLVEGIDGKFGLVVDELLGQQQVVIKSLEENSHAVDGISAATILGDGKISLILDIAQLHCLSIKIEKEKIVHNT